MNIFPFQHEPALSFYIVVYVLTLVLHAGFMTYVLAGSIYLAWASLFPGKDEIVRLRMPLAEILRDWMPFALSAAITAGVAPLLFVQIIYRQEFYTSNLLLGWRWMMVVPVLIVGFYLLYLLKSKLINQWSRAAKASVTIGVAGSFLFVAFCWTTNHLLGIDSARWPEAYASGTVVSSVVGLTLRLLMWISGAFPSMCVLALWQVAWYQRITPLGSSSDRPHARADLQILARMALGGLLLALAFGVGYGVTLDASILAEFVGSGAIWLLFVFAGAACQVIGWIRAVKSNSDSLSIRFLISIGTLGMLVGVGFIREMIRISKVDVVVVNGSVKAASDVGGFELFVGFTILNIALMAYCIRLVNRRLPTDRT